MGEVAQCFDRDDRLDGRSGDDEIEGGSGNDEIFPGEGDDDVEAGAGNDLYARVAQTGWIT
jgi:Ca2+-binding RTX toxin-like protein